jgi:hypothetical protein
MIALLIRVVAWVGSLILSILPASPFADVDFGDLDALGLHWLNWFVPVGTFLTILGVWLAAAAVYIVVQMVLRFFRVIG